MSGKYVDNGSDKLIIVFQSAGRVPQEAIISYLNKEVTDEDIGRYHEKYNWFNWTKKIEEADFYYILEYMAGTSVILEKILSMIYRKKSKVL